MSLLSSRSVIINMGQCFTTQKLKGGNVRAPPQGAPPPMAGVNNNPPTTEQVHHNQQAPVVHQRHYSQPPAAATHHQQGHQHQSRQFTAPPLPLQSTGYSSQHFTGIQTAATVKQGAAIQKTRFHITCHGDIIKIKCIVDNATTGPAYLRGYPCCKEGSGGHGVVFSPTSGISKDVVEQAAKPVLIDTDTRNVEVEVQFLIPSQYHVCDDVKGNYPLVLSLESNGGLDQRILYFSSPRVGTPVKHLKTYQLSNSQLYQLQDIYGGDDADDCVICLSDPITAVILPCRHKCLCLECAKELKQSSEKCPMCRGEITEMIKMEEA